MSDSGFHPEKTVTVRENLLFNYSKLWNLGGSSCGEDDTTLLEAIMMEDVGVEVSDLEPPEQLVDLRGSLKVLLSNKKNVKKQFAEKVKKCSQIEETGKNVGKIIKRPLEKLIPSCLLGGKKNRQIYISTVLKALTFGIKDTLPIKMFTSGIQFKRIQWLKKLNKSGIAVKSNMTAKLLLWLWRISKKLVASQYYVTEKQGSYNKLVFFYKSSWQQQSDRAFKHLIDSKCLRYLEPEEAKKIVSRRQQAKLRWLPKEEGLRPIISIRNDKLQEDTILTKSFLNGLLKLTGRDLTVTKLQEKWAEVVKHRKSLDVPQLYFVAVDIKDAYGSIIQDKLVEIVKQIVSTYLGNATVVQFDSGFCMKKRIFECRELYRGPLYRITKTKDVLVSDLLTTVVNAITSQTVKWGNKTYLMSKGISQAVSLSAALCKLYLAHLDQTHLSGLVSEENDFMLRAVDDYLFISPDKSRALKFLDRMTQGFNDYGIFINAVKTQSNLSSHTEILYYGFYFNTDNLEVYVKYAHGDNVSFKNMMTFNKWEEKQLDYSILMNKLKRIPSFKLNKLTTNQAYMTPEGLVRNVFETACLMACYFKVTVHTIYSDIDPARLVDVINQCAAIVVARVSKLTSGHSGLLKNEMYWIVFRGFKMCLELNVYSDTKGFPECILPYLEQREEETKMKTKLQFRKSIYGIVDELPLQYKNGH